MGSPHPILDGSQALSAQVSVSFEPARFQASSLRDAAQRTQAKLDIEYRHPDRFSASSTYRSYLTGRDRQLRMWRGREEPTELDAKSIDEVVVVPSTHFRKHSVVARLKNREEVLIDDIKKARDADHIAQAVREFLTIDPEELPEGTSETGEFVDFHGGNIRVENKDGAESGSKLHAIARWRRPSDFVGLALSIILCVSFATSTVLSESLAPLLITIMTLLIAYRFLTRLVNQTVVDVDEVALRVQHGPLPPAAGIARATEDIVAFDVEAQAGARHQVTARTSIGELIVTRHLNRADAEGFCELLNRHLQTTRQALRQRSSSPARLRAELSEVDPDFAEGLDDQPDKRTQRS